MGLLAQNGGRSGGFTFSIKRFSKSQGSSFTELWVGTKEHVGVDVEVPWDKQDAELSPPCHGSSCDLDGQQIAMCLRLSVSYHQHRLQWKWPWQFQAWEEPSITTMSASFRGC
jgi:hypothetical protein